MLATKEDLKSLAFMYHEQAKQHYLRFGKCSPFAFFFRKNLTETGIYDLDKYAIEDGSLTPAAIKDIATEFNPEAIIVIHQRRSFASPRYSGSTPAAQTDNADKLLIVQAESPAGSFFVVTEVINRGNELLFGHQYDYYGSRTTYSSAAWNTSD